MAILAERFAVDYSWYVDTILNLIRLAGDFVSEEVSVLVDSLVLHFVDDAMNMAGVVPCCSDHHQ